MANRFYVQPANPLEALMLGEQAYTAGRDEVRKGRVDAARQSIAQGGNPKEALQRLMAAGDIQGANVYANMLESQATQGHRAASLAQSGQHQQAMERLAREKFDFEKAQADPENAAKLAAAKAKPTDNLEAEQKLRKEFEGNVKTHIEVRRGFDRILASKDDAAGDISMIFGYMRMLDPNSVVREGEFATAQNAAGIPDQIRNIYNRALEGTRLNPRQRDMFKGQAQALYDASSREYGAREKQFRGIAGKYGIDPDRVIPSLGNEPSMQAAPGVSPPMSGPAQTSAVPPRAVEFLKANPKTAEAFDAKYGVGAAARALGVTQ